jgi:DNA invertase Pin-like site-specific DNA recombinase
MGFQQVALQGADCEKIFNDKISGSRMDCAGLTEALSHVRKGDTLVVWKLDRLGRSVKGIIELISLLEKRGAHFKSLTDQIDTGYRNARGEIFFHVMASLAQMERELIVERTQAGLAAAKAQGRVGGRKRKRCHMKSELFQLKHVNTKRLCRIITTKGN